MSDPPADGKFLQIPAGGSFSVQTTCAKGYVNYEGHTGALSLARALTLSAEGSLINDTATGWSNDACPSAIDAKTTFTCACANWPV